jgi:hypothetical protein
MVSPIGRVQAAACVRSAPCFRVRSDNPRPSLARKLRLQSRFFLPLWYILLQQEKYHLAVGATREVSSVLYGVSRRAHGAKPSATYYSYPLSGVPHAARPTSADAGLDSKHCHRQGEQSNLEVRPFSPLAGSVRVPYRLMHNCIGL